MTWLCQGQVEVSQSPQPLTTDRTPTRETLLLKALAANRDPVYIGSVSAGYPLDPGEELPITPSGPTTLNRRPWGIYVSGTVGDRIAWLSLRA